MSDFHTIYDLRHPSPPSLQHFASNALALDLWRCEVKHYLKSDGTFGMYDPLRKTPLQCLQPCLPSTIYSQIERTTISTAKDLYNWMCYHSSKLPPKFGIFNHFTDFVRDLDGEIDWAETAKRLLLCDVVSDYNKFLIACMYCLEDDIVRLWPKVSSRLICDSRQDPVLNYWTCRLSNRLNEIVMEDGESSVEEVILNNIMEAFGVRSWPVAKYFLNRLSPDDCSRFMLKMLEEIEESDEISRDIGKDFTLIFCRYFLLKLDAEMLQNLVATRGYKLMICSPPSIISSVWEYVKDVINSEEFCLLVKFILRDETESRPKQHRHGKYQWSDIWTCASNDLKQSIIPSVLENGFFLFDRNDPFDIDIESNVATYRNVSFLLMVLSDTPVEYRKRFWKNNWRYLMKETKINDLHTLMNSCYDNDQSEIMQFKINTISSNYELIVRMSSSFMMFGDFTDLKGFLQFWYGNDELAIRKISLKLLRENYNPTDWLDGEIRPLNDIIDQAYPDVNIASDFKKKMLKYLMKKNEVMLFLQHSRLLHIIDFIDTFTPSEACSTQIREKIIAPVLVTLLHEPKRGIRFFLIRFYAEKEFGDNFVTFMNWLLRTDDERARFREALDVDGIVQRFLQYEKDSVVNSKSDNDYGYFDKVWFRCCFQESQLRESPLKSFLKWYFVTEEKFEEFSEKYADNEVYIQSMSKYTRGYWTKWSD